MNFAVSYDDYRRNIAAQVQQRVQFHRSLALAKLGPGKERQTQIDRCRIQRVDSILEFDAKAVVDIQMAGDGDQSLREVCVDAPVAHLIRIRQSVARDATANAHVIELRASRAQTRFDVAETLAIGQLRKRHAQELIPA